MGSCKNCGVPISPLEKDALRKQIYNLIEKLIVLEIRQKCQNNDFCDEFCEQRYHGEV